MPAPGISFLLMESGVDIAMLPLCALRDGMVMDWGCHCDWGQLSGCMQLSWFLPVTTPKKSRGRGLSGVWLIYLGEGGGESGRLEDSSSTPPAEMC